MKRLFVVIVVVAVLAGLGFVGYTRWTGRTQASAIEVPTVAIKRGTIVATVNATGALAPEAQVTLGFKGSGAVTGVYVEKGDHVRVGDSLAQLDTAQLELQVAQAEATLAVNEARLTQLQKGPGAEDLASAEAALASARASYAQIEAGPSDEDLASAIANLESAKENLARVQAGPTAAQLAAAEAALKAAEDSYQRAIDRPSTEDLQQARLKLDQAKNNLWAAQAQRDSVKGNPASTGGSKDSAEANVAVAEISVQLAELAYQQAQEPATAAEIERAAAEVARARDELERLQESPTASELAAAQAQVAQAEAQLDKLHRSPTESELKSAAAQVAQAQAQLDKLKKGPDPEELVIAQAQVDQARAAVELVKLQLADATLVSPVEGTVVAVNASEGELISSGMPMVILIDTSQYHIDLKIDEADISLVAVEQEAAITLDAFPDRQLSGKVTWIDPQGAVTQGVVNYGVRIDLDPAEIPIKPNMTANVDIAVARKEGVLLVPNQAIRRDRQGEYVEVLAGDETRQVYVNTGLEGGEVTEIVTNLQEGDQVVVSAGPTFNFQRMMEQSGGGPFGSQGSRGQ